MEIGSLSNIYLIIFMPLISSLLCQIIHFKNSSFLIYIVTIFLLFFLILKIFPDILIYEIIQNDYQLAISSLALEFSLDLVGIIFLSMIIFLLAIIMLFYHHDVKNTLSLKNQSHFYSVQLLNLFSIIGLICSNNIFNIFFFIEIYSFTFFAITTISYNLRLLQLSFKIFCFSAVSSILILICFYAIYLTFGAVNLNKIVENLFLMPIDKMWFIMLIFIILSLAFIFKFFPIWQYFKKITNKSVIANFIMIDAFFIKVLIGIFISLKFIYFFFGSKFIFSYFNLAKIFIFSAFTLIIYSSIKLNKTKNLKLICIFLTLNNLGFIILTSAMQSVESLQALFFFLLNFTTVNLGFFLLASYLKNNLNILSLNQLYKIKNFDIKILIPLKLIIAFVIALPFTFLFFGYWYIGLASVENNINFIALIVLLFSGFGNFLLLMKIIKSFQTNNLFNNMNDFSTINYWQIIALWIVISAIILFIFLSDITNQMSLRFASFLTANSI